MNILGGGHKRKSSCRAAGIDAYIDTGRAQCEVVVEISGVHEHWIARREVARLHRARLADNGARANEDVVLDDCCHGDPRADADENSSARPLIDERIVDDVQIVARVRRAFAAVGHPSPTQGMYHIFRANPLVELFGRDKPKL